MKKNEDGYVWAPFITKIKANYINGEVVWYDNKWKNLLLKIKHFFIKPKYLKHISKYKDKEVNPNFYGKVNIGKHE